MVKGDAGNTVKNTEADTEAGKTEADTEAGKTEADTEAGKTEADTEAGKTRKISSRSWHDLSWREWVERMSYRFEPESVTSGAPVESSLRECIQGISNERMSKISDQASSALGWSISIMGDIRSGNQSNVDKRLTRLKEQTDSSGDLIKLVMAMTESISRTAQEEAESDSPSSLTECIQKISNKRMSIISDHVELALGQSIGIIGNIKS
jgi:hypothetical protein